MSLPRAVFAGLAIGLLGILVIALTGRGLEGAGTDGMCVPESPLHRISATARPCGRLALNLVTLPYITGAVLLLPRLPGRLVMRALHTLGALALVAVVAAVASRRPAILQSPGALFVAGSLAALVLTGALQHLSPDRGRHRRWLTVRDLHLCLAAFWIVLVIGSTVMTVLAGRGD